MPRLPLTAIVLLGLFGVLTPNDADAYLDPGTGSAVIQMVVAGVMGALFLTKLYWQKLLAFFGMGSAEESDQAQPPASNEHE